MKGNSLFLVIVINLLIKYFIKDKFDIEILYKYKVEFYFIVIDNKSKKDDIKDYLFYYKVNNSIVYIELTYYNYNSIKW